MALALRGPTATSWWSRLRLYDDLPEAPNVQFSELDLPPARCVAVCDDDLPFIRFVERALVSEGASVAPVTTLDPEEAVRVIAQSGCDAALIDLHMYNDDVAGITIARMLRADPATEHMRLRLATGAAPRDLRGVEGDLVALRCGLLPKPFTESELLVTLGLAEAASNAA